MCKELGLKEDNVNTKVKKNMVPVIGYSLVQTKYNAWMKDPKGMSHEFPFG